MSDTEAKLTEIRQRRAAVPDGPWEQDIDFAVIGDEDGVEEYNVGAVRIRMSASHTVDGSFKEAEFIAHAPEDIDWLIRAVDRLRGMLADRVNEVQRLKERLAELEWAGTDLAWYPENVPVCPVCKGLKEGTDAGHTEDCWLAVALERNRRPLE